MRSLNLNANGAVLVLGLGMVVAFAAMIATQLLPLLHQVR